jgi:hypothetical protein
VKKFRDRLNDSVAHHEACFSAGLRAASQWRDDHSPRRHASDVSDLVGGGRAVCAVRAAGVEIEDVR